MLHEHALGQLHSSDRIHAGLPRISNNPPKGMVAKLLGGHLTAMVAAGRPSSSQARACQQAYEHPVADGQMRPRPPRPG